MNITERLESLLYATKKLQEIHHDSKSLVLGKLGGDVGISHENNVKEYFTGNSTQFCKHLGISPEEYFKLLDNLFKEFQTREVKVRFFRFWAQKIQ